MAKATRMAKTAAVRWPPRVEKRRGTMAPERLRFRRLAPMNGAFSTTGAGLDPQARQAALAEVEALIRRFAPEPPAASGEGESIVTPAAPGKAGSPKTGPTP